SSTAQASGAGRSITSSSFLLINRSRSGKDNFEGTRTPAHSINSYRRPSLWITPYPVVLLPGSTPITRTERALALLVRCGAGSRVGPSVNRPPPFPRREY